MTEFEGLGPIGQVAMTVGDVPEAVSYYQDRLGMRLLFESGGMAFFDCGGIRLLLGSVEDRGEVGGGEDGGGGRTIVYYRVADIGEAHEALLGRGVEFVEGPRKVAEVGGAELWLAFLRDPWENVLALMSEVPMA